MEQNMIKYLLYLKNIVKLFKDKSIRPVTEPILHHHIQLYLDISEHRPLC